MGVVVASELDWACSGVSQSVPSDDEPLVTAVTHTHTRQHSIHTAPPTQYRQQGPAHSCMHQVCIKCTITKCHPLWPDDLRDPSLSADIFRKRLKTHLFQNALGHVVH